MPASYDVIVVGLGAAGSAATYHLAKRGHNVLGLDMFEPGHDKGSSHGEHRLIRRSSFTGSGYIPLAARAFELWDELEQESGQNIFKVMGEIRLAYPDENNNLRVATDEMVRQGICEILDETQLAERFPGVRLHDGMVAVYEPDAGFLRPEVAIAAHLELAARHGATIQRPEEVTGWTVDGDGVRVETTQDSYSADRLIITTGPWAPELLKDINLPLQVVRIVNGYFEPTRPDWWKAENGAPDFVMAVPEGNFYGMPSVEGIGVKIGRHTGPETTARTIRREVDDSEIQALRDALDKYLPGASGPDVKRITCMYTNTPDEDFIVDLHPEYRQVAIGCGFSGRGFKFSCVSGEILADLAIDGATSHDIDFISARRFVGTPAANGE